MMSGHITAPPLVQLVNEGYLSTGTLQIACSGTVSL